MKKPNETKMRFLKVSAAPHIGDRVDRAPDGTETRTPFHYPLEAFLDEYVWGDDRWSVGVDGDAEAWALAFDRLTDALAGKLAEGAEIALEPEDWLKLRLVATTVTHLGPGGVRVSGVDPRIARVVRKAHQNAIILARSGPAVVTAPPDEEDDSEDAASMPS